MAANRASPPPSLRSFIDLELLTALLAGESDQHPALEFIDRTPLASTHKCTLVERVEHPSSCKVAGDRLAIA